MSLSISPVRTAVQDIANRFDSELANLGRPGGHEHGLDSGQSANQSPDPSAMGIFAAQPQNPVNFAPPDVPNKVGAVGGAGEAQQPDILDQLLQVIQKAVMQWLQAMLKPQQDDDSADDSVAPAQNGGGGGVGDAGGGSPVKGASGGAPASGAGGAGAVDNAGGLSSGGELHLPKQLEPYRADILDAAKATGMPAKVIAGQIWAESRGNLGAASTNVNGKTDAGLMQINADTFAGLKKENPGLLGNANVNNAHDNILAGALYLRDQAKAFSGNIGAALRAYNSGPDKVNTRNLADTGGVGSSSYPADVLKFAEIIGSGKGQLPA
ncbi:hypothetical protein AWM79_18845 [Pseudomonas agarici]|uniref:Transglycosylase SLT domain-containing protein n=1 Tax=Pseudomonas agarici TaxID=46677 RepID=A0A0X1T584_PSEAA|nr:hypothetical protein AWM79_18845 [Pseudomonas agarici]NWB92680.1 lytic transglycosylase domain-containing protein [Pseudomonas agarici]NWC10640.1 lytic transglycosylase domain-containing protein [Pseudomonas agarici]SEL11854.1 Transglycosylase SLT domain-containing protein [Pseudomonas agarici]